MNAEYTLRDRLLRDSILRIGEVIGVSGRTIKVKVDSDKNLSDLLFDGKVVKNISVDSYLEIRKGFLSLIGKVDGEEIKEEPEVSHSDVAMHVEKIKRVLTVSLVGYLDENGVFDGGTKELPLIGNEAFVVAGEIIHAIHDLAELEELRISIAKSEENSAIFFPVDRLFNGHIAIFGNTGSGKSNTLASLYQHLVSTLQYRNPDSFKKNTRYLMFDFNGEFGDGCGDSIITCEKQVYFVHEDSEKPFPMRESALFNQELLSILTDATEKTQKPFLRRVLNSYYLATGATNSNQYVRAILVELVKRVLALSEKEKASQLVDSVEFVLTTGWIEGNRASLRDEIEWFGGQYGAGFRFRSESAPKGWAYPNGNPESESIVSTTMYQEATKYCFPNTFTDRLIAVAYMKFIEEVNSNRVQIDHIGPWLGRLVKQKKDIEDSFEISENENYLWNTHNFIIVNLDGADLHVKKSVPLLIAKAVYDDHKQHRGKKTLNIIVDEAHQILSHQSSREDESWKDYRLETFEEIVKEGRKFGVFLTFSSQRPYDISPTIASQAHNYFIHRLVNKNDLDSISNAVSYIDKLTEESIPTLATGTCVFSGIAGKRPLKIRIKELPEEQKPRSQTLKFAEIVEESQDQLKRLSTQNTGHFNP